MRKFVLITAVLIMPFIGIAQKLATTFQDAEKAGYSIAKLDSVYKSALHDDATKSAFKGQEKEFMQAYRMMLQDLGGFLKENNYQWGKTTRCFNRIYFAKDGTIDFFLFHFNPDQLSVEKQRQFQTLLAEFIRGYEFGMKGKEKFAQCSPVSYSDI